MPVTILIGAQWGDEGKGRVADWLAESADIVARYAGGDNAGHTITVGEEIYKLHLLPAGIIQQSSTNILGHGMVVNPAKLIEELDMLKTRGIEITPDQLLLSERAHIITPAHRAIDAAREASRGDDAIGTTKRGIGPAYTDKIQRSGLLAYQMRDEESFGDAIKDHVERANKILTAIYGQEPLDPEQIAAEYTDYARRLVPYIQDITPFLDQALAENKRILCEGAQGTLLDIDLGHYPFVTSSSPTVAGAISGIGVGPKHIDTVLGVAKAFSTRVGAGPMPTELDDEIGDFLRGTGDKPWDEFGTTTGRARRTGWLDGVALKYASTVNGFTQMVLTKLDILSGLDEVKIAVAYEIDGKRIEHLPANSAEAERAVPIYETFEGWQEDIMEIRHWDDLPASAQAYVETIEKMIGCPISWVSVGPRRDQAVMRNK